MHGPASPLLGTHPREMSLRVHPPKHITGMLGEALSQTPKTLETAPKAVEQVDRGIQTMEFCSAAWKQHTESWTKY